MNEDEVKAAIRNGLAHASNCIATLSGLTTYCNLAIAALHSKDEDIEDVFYFRTAADLAALDESLSRLVSVA